jgi:predicted nucleic acid-binding protein
MIRKVFVDSDVILDVLANREPHNQPARILFSKIDRGEVKGCTSPVVFAHVFYILRKLAGPASAKSMLRKLRMFFQVLPMDGRTVDGALDTGLPDFEDAMQYRCAVDAGVETIITRNSKDFKGIPIRPLSADEFLLSLR